MCRCGAEFSFVVSLDEDNEPRNILEEIVWHKAVEIDEMRSRMPLTRLTGLMVVAPPARYTTLSQGLRAVGRGLDFGEA